MTNHVVRLYALAITLLVVFVFWAAIAARPWQVASGRLSDPRLAALAAREQRLRHDAVVVKNVVDRRWAAYRVALAGRKAQISDAQRAASLAAATPSVRVVTLPPLTVTRTS